MDADVSLSLALLLQLEWGADESVGRDPVVRLGRTVAPPPERPPLPQTVRPQTVRPRALPAHPAAGDPADDTSPDFGDDSLAAWKRDLGASDGAGLAATATNLVLPVGPPSGLLVLADAPGPDEDRSGEGFVGPSGQFVRKMLASAGIEPDGVMLAYVVPWRPPGGRPPSEAELAAAMPFLRRLIRLTSPRLALALGSLAAKTLTGAPAKRRRWTQATIPGLPGGLPVLPTASPAVLLQQPGQKPASWADLRMLRRRMDELAAS